MTTSINDAIAAAKAQAAAIVPPQAQVPASVPGRKLTMADVSSTSVNVDSWLQVSEHGIQIAKSADLLDELIVEIDMSEVVICYVIRYGKAPVNYKKSYDGVTTFGSPEPWDVTIAKAQQFDPTCRGQYSCAEIPMTLLEDIKLPKEKKVVEAGTRTGYSTSVTGFREFQRFYNDLTKAGRENDVVKVKLGWEKKSGNGNVWGVITYTLVNN